MHLCDPYRNNNVFIEAARELMHEGIRLRRLAESIKKNPIVNLYLRNLTRGYVYNPLRTEPSKKNNHTYKGQSIVFN